MGVAKAGALRALLSSSAVTAAEADEATTSAAQAFINRWKGVTASELSTSQSFVIQLCELLGVEAPHPTPEQSYMFERPITFQHGDGSTSAGRVDCYKRGHFVWESKKLKLGKTAGVQAQQTPDTPPVTTKAFDDALLRARPDLSPEDVYWRLHFTLGMLHNNRFAEFDRLNVLSEGQTSEADKHLFNVMAAVAKSLTDEEIEAVSSYMQGLHARPDPTMLAAIEAQAASMPAPAVPAEAQAVPATDATADEALDAAIREAQARGLVIADRVGLDCELSLVCRAGRAGEPVIAAAWAALDTVWT